MCPQPKVPTYRKPTLLSKALDSQNTKDGCLRFWFSIPIGIQLQSLHHPARSTPFRFPACCRSRHRCRLARRETGDGRRQERRGFFHTSAHSAACIKHYFLTNVLKLIVFFSLPSSHAPIRALMIAKRQSISREKAMKAIVAISQMTGSGLGAGTQGR